MRFLTDLALISFIPLAYFVHCGGIGWLISLDWREQARLLIALRHEHAFWLSLVAITLVYLAILWVLNGIAEREAIQSESFVYEASSANGNLRRRTSF